MTMNSDERIRSAYVHLDSIPDLETAKKHIRNIYNRIPYATTMSDLEEQIVALQGELEASREENTNIISENWALRDAIGELNETIGKLELELHETREMNMKHEENV